MLFIYNKWLFYILFYYILIKLRQYNVTCVGKKLYIFFLDVLYYNKTLYIC